MTAAAYVHPTAVIDDGATLGSGVKVWHHAHVCAGATIGPDSVLGQNVYVGPGVVIGRGCKVQNNVSVYEGVELGDHVFVGPSAVFTNVRTPRAHVSRRDAFQTTRVQPYVTIGANATVVCGATLGEGAFIAAGAVVTGDVAPHVLIQGAPGRPAGHMCRCGERLRAEPEPTCGTCGARYTARADGGLDHAGAGA